MNTSGFKKCCIRVYRTITMVRTVVSAAIKGENSKYEEAVKTLNTLQTNAQTLEKIRVDRDKNAHLNIPKMTMFAERVGIVERDMDKLNVIHVSGTKGKGSTCAYCESILRHHGYKTGFFSSPHLVEVRERFCVNGEPLERDKFAHYFWDVYNKLDKSKPGYDGAMPNYFGFLTVMALHVFLHENVDVAVMEVGIGGQYDCTNLIKNPVVTGVTSLGLDHTSILGKSIDKIAWHKAGIFKPGVPAYTAPQLPEAMDVLKQRAGDIGAPLHMCPDMRSYSEAQPHLGIKGTIQQINASLALQLCHTWMEKHKNKKSSTTDQQVIEAVNTDQSSIPTQHCDIRLADKFTLTSKHLQGLEYCKWLGRNQTIQSPGVTFYLDGAHTVESIEQCVDWFKTDAQEEKSTKQDGVYRVLIFNTTGDRDATHLLHPLVACEFDAVLFCPNLAYEKAISADQTNNTVTKDSQLKRCQLNKDSWEQLLGNIQSEKSTATKTTNQNGHINSNQSQTITTSVGGATNGHMVEDDQSSQLNGENEIFNENKVKNEQIGDNNPSKTEIQELHAFPSISHCINWVCKKQYGGVLRVNDSALNKPHSVHGNNSSSAAKEQNVDILNCNEKMKRDVVRNKDKDLENGGGDGLGIKPAEQRHTQVLITGSLHLVGGALKVLWDKQT